MRPSPEWKVLLEPFESLFTKPGYRYFCAFVFVFAHLDQRLWVTQVVLSGLVDRHYTSFYRFLKAGAWSVEAVRQQVWACAWRAAPMPAVGSSPPWMTRSPPSLASTLTLWGCITTR